MKRINLLGSTASIGLQTLDVAREHGYKIEALTAYSNVDIIENQIREFKPEYAALVDEKAANDINQVKDLADVIIVAMHWGNEYSFKPSQTQINIANHLSSLGVDIIIGTHPHVVQPVEYINNGQTLVIYSLGNAISDQVGIERLTGLMMEVTINKHVDVEDNVTVSVVNPKAELIYTKSYYSYDRRFKIYPYPMLNDSLLKNYNSYYEKYKGIVNSRYSGITWGITGE